MVFGSRLSQRFGSDRRGANGARVEHFPRILYIGNFRWDSKDVNQSKSKKRSSSCRCTMTLYGENEETKNIVLRVLSKLQNRLENSQKDVGRFWSLGPKRNCMEPILTNRVENGTKLLKAWCSTLPKADILYFVPPVPWKEENWEA